MSVAGKQQTAVDRQQREFRFKLLLKRNTVLGLLQGKGNIKRQLLNHLHFLKMLQQIFRIYTYSLPDS